MTKQVTVADIKHPLYEERYRDWDKWRRTYEGGQLFIERYLQKFSSRESNESYQKRKSITYNPAFAKAAVDEIKNSIFNRFVDIERNGGSETYERAVAGQDRGVDLLGSSMNSFVGRIVLPELLVMSRVGVYVDMPQLSGVTLAETYDKRPYVYIYKTEDIQSWTYDEGGNSNEFTNVLLRDYYTTYDAETGLATGCAQRYRRLWIDGGQVMVQFYNKDGEKTYWDGEKSDGTSSVIALEIPRIPFVLLEISDSLLAEVSNYQIALLNLASSDMAYALHANFPFYTEQFEPRAANEFQRKPGNELGGQAADGTAGKTEEVKVGPTQGRRYPKGTDRPGFIAPPTEPLKASMEKQEQLKREIRQLVNLAVTNLQPKMASAESKGLDRQGLESGLSYIGLELENMERKIADYWAMYERSEAATVFYPEDYSIKSAEERRAEAKDLAQQLPLVPSQTYRKQLCKKIAELLLGRSMKGEQLDKMMREIDTAKGMTADFEVIAKHVEIGICDLETASEISGYPKGTVEKAQKDHADRLKRIAETQTPKNGMVNGAPRGNPDQDPDPGKSGSDEKKDSRDTTADPVVKDKVRGEGD